jgi:hypothetical protein
MRIAYKKIAVKNPEGNICWGDLGRSERVLLK